MKMKKLHTIAFAFLVGMFVFVNTAKAAGTYTLTAAANPALVASWKKTTAPVGSNPTDFISINQIFSITNNAAMISNWTVSGSGSKISIANGGTLSDGGHVITTIAIEVIGGGTLKMLGIANVFTSFNPKPNSTVEYAATAGTQSVFGNTYSNLKISGSTTIQLGGSSTVTKVLTINGGSVLTLGGLILALNGTIVGAGTIKGDNAATINVQSSAAALGTMNFTPGSGVLNFFGLYGSGMVTLGSDLTIQDDGSLASTFDYGTGNLNLNGHTLTTDVTCQFVNFPAASTEVITGSAASSLKINCDPATGVIIGSLFMDQTSAASSSLSVLTLNDGGSGNTLTIGNILNITDSIVPTNGIIDAGGFLTLYADPATVGHTGRIGVMDGIINMGSVAGNIVSQVYHSPTTNNTDWRNLGVAGISNATFSAWNSQFGMTCPTCPITSVGGQAFSSVTTYDEPTEAYPDITYGSTIVPGIGYWVYLGNSSPSTASGPILVSVTGTPQTGIVTAALTNSDPGALKGYNLVANPYASPISFTKLKANHAGIDNVWYTYSPGYGDNAAWVGGISTPVYSHGGTGIDATIPAGMGFFVHANAPGTLTFIENLKVTGSNEVLLKGSNPNSAQSLYTYFRMQVNGSGMTNEAVVRFDANATTGFDGDYDLYDMAPGVAGWLQISSSSLGKAYTVNSLPDLTQNYSIPVTVTTATTGAYQFVANDLQNMPSGACIILHDKYTSVDHDLHSGSFSVTLTDTETVARFVLNITVVPLQITTNSTQAICYDSNDGFITAIGNNSGPWNYFWKDASNNIIKTSLNISTADSLKGLANGVYSVDVTTVGSCDIATKSFTFNAPAATTSAFTASTTSVNVNSNVTFTDNSGNANAYWWTFGDSNTSNMQNPTYAYPAPGIYTVTLNSINTTCGDTAVSKKVITVLGTTSIVSAASNEEIIFSKDQNGAYVKFNYSNQTKVNINVYNSLGQVLLANASLAVVNDKIYLNLDNAKDQMVFVSIANLDKNTQVTKKLYNN